HEKRCRNFAFRQRLFVFIAKKKNDDSHICLCALPVKKQKRFPKSHVSLHGRKQTIRIMPAQGLQTWLRPPFVHTVTPPLRKNGTDGAVHTIHAASCEHIPVCAHGEKNYINENREIQLFCHRLLSSGPGVRVTLGAPIKSSTYEIHAHRCFLISNGISNRSVKKEIPADVRSFGAARRLRRRQRRPSQHHRLWHPAGRFVKERA
ncbi:MAG: hypothetical protein II737_06915, partial [Mailhella sp.]|nr:hypothetical protein [Mailhella sp.]